MRLLEDFRYAWRLLCKTPGFSSLCIGVIAIGLAVSLTTYSLVYNFAFKTPDFPNSDRFVVLSIIDNATGEYLGSSHLNEYTVNRIIENVSEFDTIGAMQQESTTFSDGETAQYYVGVRTSPNLMIMTKAAPMLGRILHNSDAEPGADPVAVISEKIWRQYYGADANIIGKVSRINGQPYAIVGVMAEDFVFPDVVQDLWLPLTFSGTSSASEKGELIVVGSLKEDRSKAQASQSITAVIQAIDKEYPNSGYSFSIQVRNHISILLGDGGKSVANLMLGIAVIVFALCCVNLGTLLIVRATGRIQELAVRNAIGANAWQLTSQVLIESFLICFIAGLFAIALTIGSITLLKLMFTNVMAEAEKGVFATLSVNDTQILIAAATTLLLWLITGGITTLKITRSDANTILNGVSKGTTDNKLGIGVVKLIVGAEVIMSVFLVSLCGMFALSVNQAYNADYGVAIENRFVGEISLNTTDYEDSIKRREFSLNLLRQLRSEPQFQEVTMTSCPPGDRCNVTPFTFTDRILGGNKYPEESVIWTADNYFSTMEVDLKAGRFFDKADTQDTPPVVIVSSHFVQSYFPGENVLGKEIILDPLAANETLTIVGVVDHIIQGSPNDDAANRPSFYRPLLQNTPSQLSVIVHTLPHRTTSTVRDILRFTAAELDKNIPIVDVNTMEQFFVIQRDILGPVGKLFIAIAAVTLLLSVLGIFGVIYRSVLSRRLEIGIRKSVGSDNFAIISIFLKQGLIFIVIGALVGGGATILASQSLTSLFVDILHYLPHTLIFTVSVIGALILIASYTPAKKMVAMEPGDALRYE